MAAPARRLHEEAREGALGRGYSAPELRVVEGGAARAAKATVSPQFVAVCRLLILALCLVFSLSIVRIAVTATCVSDLSANAGIRDEISKLEDTNRKLSVEEAVLSNTNRIATIAMQNYGMVYAGPEQSDSITITPQG